MFGKMQMKEKEKRFERLDFFSLTRKYWKEQAFFYILTTLSCVSSLVIDQNLKQIFLGKQKLIFFGISRDFSENFSENKKEYIVNVLLGLLSHFLIVFAHVWFALHLEAKVRRYLKKLIVQKMFNLGGLQDKQKVSSLLNYGVKKFSKDVFYIPNQLYYVVLEVLLIIISHFQSFRDEQLKSFESVKQVRTLFFLYLFIFSSVCVVSQFLLYQLELGYHNSIENEIKEELFLIENSNLIIKKSESSEFLRTYNKSLDNIFYRDIARNSSETFSFVFPSYFLVKFFPFLCLYYAGDLNKIIVDSIISLNNVFSNIRKFVERGRDFPFYYSAEKKINEFLSGRERDDRQNGKTIPGYIQSIEFNDVSFAYRNEGGGSKKTVLNNFNVFFGIGRINEMNFPNGFGKSTIIDLITGMLGIQEGRILVNGIYSLGEINLDWWRSNISYSEHRNLISRRDLSTGQKQLADLNNAFKGEEKQIFIFDEADSNLDYKNRNEFLDKLKELSIKKLVILVSHHTQK